MRKHGLTITAAIPKAQITPLHELVGAVNADAFEIDGAVYAPGTLMFAGFTGRGGPGQIYSGVFTFAPSAGPNERAIEFHVFKQYAKE